MALTIQALLQAMINQHASDLHLRSNAPAYLRVDGDLQAVPESMASTQEVEQMLMTIVNPRAKKIYERIGECDFSFQAGEVARFRVNAFHQRGLLCLAIRHISMVVPTIDQLKLPAATIRKIADNQRGLVLVTGITGSGKSSTLAGMVDYINGMRSEHVITVEDPIEFVHKDKKCIISQREIGDDTLTFVDALRMAMRQDPDVIMMGEMRDLETVSAALTAAETGHLVLGTLHTIDAIQSIARVVDLYPPHQQAVVRIQLAETLKAVISQRLLSGLSGGRLPAVEVLVVTAHVRKLIEENNSQGILTAMSKGAFYGMQTFNQSLVKLYRDGMVSEEEILAAASSPDDVKMALRGIEQEVKT